MKPPSFLSDVLETFLLVWQNLSTGARLLLVLAALSSLGVLLWKPSEKEGMEFWIFSRNHLQQFQPRLEKWNAEHPDQKAHLSLITLSALERRLLSSFYAGIPPASLVELEVSTAPRFFAGPIESLGFIDLTDRIREEGIDEIILPASFSPWTTRGHIMGIPNDVHPVLLAYRQDLVEEAGIDLSRVETWDDYFAAMKPLMADNNNDGRPDRYLLSFSLTNAMQLEVWMMQGGGLLFEEEQPVIDSDLNAWLLSKIVCWSEGPNQVTVDAPEFSASGNRMKLDGFVASSFMPDWLCNTWKTDLPQLAGKYRLMPLPAWKPGGLRTSVQGGTMICIPRNIPDVEAAWNLAKHLYLSEEAAVALYTSSDIISPVSAHWDHPMYDEPSAYFGGQLKGQLYLEYAKQVPVRPSSPFLPLARNRLSQAALELRQYARDNELYDPEALQPEAKRLLGEAQAAVVRQMKRNVFLGDAAADEGAAP